LAKEAGLDLDPWQQLVVRGAFAEKADRTWAAKEVGLIVPRQNGKGSILEAVELAYMFLFDARLVLHSAHEFKTAKVAYRRIRDLVESTPFLRSQVRQWRQSNDDVSLELKSGAFLRFVARSSGSTRGFTADAVILDESYNLSVDSLAAMLPTTITNPNAQFWYTSSAGMETSDVLASIRERGRSGDPRLAYFEWSAPDDADLDDRDAWAQANPGLGIRIEPDSVATMRAALDERGFAREHLGIWHDPRTGQVIAPEVWAELADGSSQVLDPVAFAVELSWDRSIASIALAGRRADGLFHVEVVKNQRGTGWVVDDLEKLAAKWDTACIVLDSGGPAGSLLPALEERGVKVQKTSTNEMKQACGGFYDAVMEQRIRHVDAPVLNTALAAARKRMLQDAWAWQRKDSTTDITPLVAATLALWGYAHYAAQPKPKKPSAAFAF
jgi:phage terminase large subunit-like protein